MPIKTHTTSEARSRPIQNPFGRHVDFSFVSTLLVLCLDTPTPNTTTEEARVVAGRRRLISALSNATSIRKE